QTAEPATAKPVETPLAASTGPEDDSNPCRSFTWDDYLQNTGAIAADSDTFHHVEAAHASLCRPGMLFALPWKRDTYWPVRIATVSGPLLGVQFVGAASSVAKEQHQHQQPVWYSVASKTGKSLDWCRQNPTLVKPPPEVRVGDSSDTADDAVLKSLLLGKGEGEGEDAPTEMLDGDALQPAERILEGGLLECCDCLMPYALWFVKVVSNRGGRLQLVWMDEQCSEPRPDREPFYLFFTSHRLHPLGFGASDSEQKSSLPYYYSPSLTESGRVSNESATSLSSSWQPALAGKFMRKHRAPPQHRFRLGHRMEAVHPVHRRTIQPASVVSVIDKHFFIVELDDLRPPSERQSVKRLCTAETCEIFAANTCASRSLPLTPPPGHSGHFTWAGYLASLPASSDGQAAQAPPDSYFQLPDEEFDFCLGEKLEMVSQEEPANTLVPATITRFIGRLMLLHLNHLPPLSPPILVDMGSTSLFHVGWAELNGHRMSVPFCYQQAAHHKRLLTNVHPPSWCSKIYVNSRCHVGPSLSKGSVDGLPKSLGPGDVCVLLEDLISRIVQAAYNPTKVLKDIERDPEEPRDSLAQRPMKAKFKGKSYSSIVQLCNNSMFLDEYLKQFCIRLKACPYFVSVFRLRTSCPETCQARLKKLLTVERLPRKTRPPRLLRPNASASNLPQLEQQPQHQAGGDDSYQGGADVDDDLASNHSSANGGAARLLVSEKVDGQAFLLLTLPTVVSGLGLSLSASAELCHCVWQLKKAFFQQFANS
uniref:SLED domain-containing protein n=1 Tax=Macrostomum lignano TaxID=282301 RepID=A0A1I8FZU2_9PLAT